MSIIVRRSNNSASVVVYAPNIVLKTIRPAPCEYDGKTGHND